VGFFPAVLADLTAQAQGGGKARFEHQRLYDGVYVCVMRKDHPLATGSSRWTRFCEARHMLVSFSGRPYGFIDEALASLGPQAPRVVLTVNQFFTAGRVVATSDLLTVLPRHFIRVTGMAKTNWCARPALRRAAGARRRALAPRPGAAPDHAWLRQAVATAARKAFGRASD
jgi:DNA-binding transcriptional LysR family regulator